MVRRKLVWLALIPCLKAHFHKTAFSCYCEPRGHWFRDRLVNCFCQLAPKSVVLRFHPPHLWKIGQRDLERINLNLLLVRFYLPSSCAIVDSLALAQNCLQMAPAVYSQLNFLTQKPVILKNDTLLVDVDKQLIYRTQVWKFYDITPKRHLGPQLTHQL